jgi:hypothetical protein
MRRILVALVLGLIGFGSAFAGFDQGGRDKMKTTSSQIVVAANDQGSGLTRG